MQKRIEKMLGRITPIERKNEAIIQLEKKVKLRDKKIKKLKEENKVLIHAYIEEFFIMIKCENR
jgi:hypothetical protein